MSGEIKCPHCGEMFTIDESQYASILKQVRDAEFTKDLLNAEKQFNLAKDAEIRLAIQNTESGYKESLSEKEKEILTLKSEVAGKDAKAKLDLQEAVSLKDKEILELKNLLHNKDLEKTMEKETLVSRYESLLKMKDDEVAYYKDLKAKLSTKMVGESLEQHCLTEFEKLRSTAFKNAYFAKDNEVVDNTKGDFIYRDYTDEGQEYISIMFEMKNEMDETRTKHTNESFFDKLDKDRKKKNCEYAVLVSMLEPDSELYNQGIVDVSHKYEKMYVIRPQFFIPLISILRNSAQNSIGYMKQLEEVKAQNIDITNFEKEIQTFKDSFNVNYQRASKNFENAIDEIDKTIKELEKVKESLLKTNDNLRIANNKADDLSIKRLTKNSPLLREEFAKLAKEQE